MRLAVICFSRMGAALCRKLIKGFRELGIECDGYGKSRFFDEEQEKGDLPIRLLKEPAGEWTRRQFGHSDDSTYNGLVYGGLIYDGLIYIGAAGIAVRAVGPCLKDKMTDPAVVVVDEAGRYAISLLSGHVGGANRLAELTAQIAGAVPVITTATDVRGITAVDAWAADRGLKITSRHLAKQVSAALLEGKPVGFYSDFSLAEPMPDGYVWGKHQDINVWITTRETADKQMLRLVPPILTVGIGCRKGVPASRIEEEVEFVFREAGQDKQAVSRIASIDLKKREPGLCELAERWKVPLSTFSAAELENVQAPVQESAFVRRVTGTGNVCERAALLGAGDGSYLLIRKHVGDSVTVAVAAENYQVGKEQKIQ